MRVVNLMLFIGLLLFTGCASLLSLESSKSEIVRDRVCAMNNPAIKAVALNSGAGIGVDIGNLQALSQHPWRQLGAALLDAGTAYVAYVGGKQLVSPSQSTSPNSVRVVVSGRNNMVNINP